MRRSMVALVLVLLAFGLALVRQPQPVWACSCLPREEPPPVQFEGEAIERIQTDGFGKLWRFRVDRAIAGTTAGQTIDVAADVPEGSSGNELVSSCSLDTPISAHGNYGVSAYLGTTAEGAPRAVASECGGSVTHLDVAGAEKPPLSDDDTGSAGAARAAGAIGIVGALVGSAFAVRGRRRPAPDA